MRINFVSKACILGIALSTSAIEISNGSLTRLLQLAIVEPKQFTRTSASSNIRRTLSKSFSLISWMLVPQTLLASISRPKPYSIYNLCDDNPAPPQDIIAYAAKILNVKEPPTIRFEDANLSEMAKSFYEENKRVSNQLIKTELGIKLMYPDFKAGLKNLLKEIEG